MGMGTTSISTQAVGYHWDGNKRPAQGWWGICGFGSMQYADPLGLGIRSWKSCGVGVGPAGLGWYRSRGGAGQK